MVLTTFVKVSIAVGIITLACLVIVALLNIYWYSDEVEPALEDCIGPHLKMVANAILLMFGIIAGIVFGIGTYRLAKTPELEEDKEDTLRQEILKSSKSVDKEIEKVSAIGLTNAIVGYAVFVAKSKESIDSDRQMIQNNLVKHMGISDAVDKEGNELILMKIARENSEAVSKMNQNSDSASQEAQGILSMLKKQMGVELTRNETGDNIYDPIFLEELKRLRQLFKETRENAFKANILAEDSRKALHDFNRTIEYNYYEQSKARQY